MPPIVSPLVPLRDLPSVLAIPLGAYSRETYEVQRLYRLREFVEMILTRFCTIVVLGKWRV